MTNSNSMNAAEAARPADSPRWERLQRRLVEAYEQLWDDFVDPREALWDADGSRWLALGAENEPGQTARGAFANAQEHREIRQQCRALALSNEFAINGHENRISYIVGSGHTYRATARKGVAVPPGLADEVQRVLDAFLKENQWHKRQQEIVRRRDRDGEAFLRLFVGPDGTTRVRFVEPGQVAAPDRLAGDLSASFGIQTDPDDVETVLAYYIDGRAVDAAEIQHRKANVDANVKRGLPLFYPVRKNLRRAEKLLRNMSVVAEIQSAIALIRKHQGGSRTAVQQFVESQADASARAAGKTQHFRRYAPGTILDAHGGIEYDFPTAGIDAGSYVTVLQAELRAVASRLVMPEFMLTSDASNANFASTMVAEGPAVKMFQRLQRDMIVEDLEVMHRVVRHAVAAGRLPAEAMSCVEIQVGPPSLSVRDRLKEVQADRILVQSRAMSVQTMALRHGLDPDQERRLIGEHGEVAGNLA
ncbi:MAG: phage portal protein [Pirellulales bacterium]